MPLLEGAQPVKVDGNRTGVLVVHGFTSTPLGMHPNESSMPPLDNEHITREHYVYDLIYNPARTQFLQKAEIRGATIKNGLEMLHVQAEKSWHIWNN